MGDPAAGTGKRMDTARLSFEHVVDSATMRQSVRRLLTAWGMSALAEDALLVITELVQNVEQHTAHGGELVVSRRGDAALIEVFDGDPALPTVRRPDPRRLGGRGLLIVSAMSSTWGARHLDRGKVVWAELLPQGRN
jgi:hypothetical protein